jgi:hypothetical protein
LENFENFLLKYLKKVSKKRGFNAKFGQKSSKKAQKSSENRFSRTKTRNFGPNFVGKAQFAEFLRRFSGNARKKRANSVKFEFFGQIRRCLAVFFFRFSYKNDVFYINFMYFCI